MAPRFDVNAPDLYIPAMGFITYVLVAGVALGTQNKYVYSCYSRGTILELSSTLLTAVSQRKHCKWR